jgi:hypothetical protein
VWLFGGDGLDESSQGLLNDIWERLHCDNSNLPDVSGDCIVDFKDFSVMAHYWLERAAMSP